MKVNIIYRTYGGITRSADPDDEWDRDDTYAEHTIEGISARRHERRSYESIEVDIDELSPDKDYYLVYAIYDTGDSFGRDDGRIEFFHLYEESALAIRAQNLLRETDNKATPQEIQIPGNNGQKITVHIPWHGYFEHLSYVDTQTVRVI